MISLFSSAHKFQRQVIIIYALRNRRHANLTSYGLLFEFVLPKRCDPLTYYTLLVIKVEYFCVDPNVVRIGFSLAHLSLKSRLMIT